MERKTLELLLKTENEQIKKLNCIVVKDIINLKAEVEIRNMRKKLDLLMTGQMRTLFGMQREQMDIMEEIKVVLNK